MIRARWLEHKGAAHGGMEKPVPNENSIAGQEKPA